MPRPRNPNKKLPPVELVTWSRRNTKCNFCKQWERDEEKYGPMYRCGSLTMHFFCMAFSSGISQVFPFTQGIFGFDQADVRKELKNVKKVICVYCSSGGANVKCEESSCPQSFHFTCSWGKKLLIQTEQFRALCDAHSESFLKDDGDKKHWSRGPFDYTEIFKAYSELQNNICSGKPIPSEKEMFLKHFELESSPNKPMTTSTPLKIITPPSVPASVPAVHKERDPRIASPVYEVSLPSNSFVLKFMRPENDEFVEPNTYPTVRNTYRNVTNTKIEPSYPEEVVEFSTTSSECSELVTLSPQLCESPELTQELAESPSNSVVGLISCYDRNVESLQPTTEYNDDGECLVPNYLGNIEPLDSLETYSDFSHTDNELQLQVVTEFDDMKQESEWQDSKPDKASIFGLSSCFDRNDRLDSDQFNPTVISVNLASDPNSILTPFLGGNSVFRGRSRSPSGSDIQTDLQDSHEMVTTPFTGDTLDELESHGPTDALIHIELKSNVQEIDILGPTTIQQSTTASEEVPREKECIMDNPGGFVALEMPVALSTTDHEAINSDALSIPSIPSPRLGDSCNSHEPQTSHSDSPPRIGSSTSTEKLVVDPSSSRVQDMEIVVPTLKQPMTTWEVVTEKQVILDNPLSSITLEVPNTTSATDHEAINLETSCFTSIPCPRLDDSCRSHEPCTSSSDDLQPDIGHSISTELLVVPSSSSVHDVKIVLPNLHQQSTTVEAVGIEECACDHPEGSTELETTIARLSIDPETINSDTSCFPSVSVPRQGGESSNFQEPCTSAHDDTSPCSGSSLSTEALLDVPSNSRVQDVEIVVPTLKQPMTTWEVATEKQFILDNPQHFITLETPNTTPATNHETINSETSCFTSIPCSRLGDSCESHEPCTSTPGDLPPDIGHSISTEPLVVPSSSSVQDVKIVPPNLQQQSTTVEVVTTNNCHDTRIGATSIKIELPEPLDVSEEFEEEPVVAGGSRRISQPRVPCTCPETICFCCPDTRRPATAEDHTPLAFKTLPSSSLPECQGRRFPVLFGFSSLYLKSDPVVKLQSCVSSAAISALGPSVRSTKRSRGESTPVPVPKKVRLSKKKSLSSSNDDKSSTTTSDG